MRMMAGCRWDALSSILGVVLRSSATHPPRAVFTRPWSMEGLIAFRIESLPLTALEAGDSDARHGSATPDASPLVSKMAALQGMALRRWHCDDGRK